MNNNVLAKPNPEALDKLLRSQAAALHAKDEPPADRKTWEERRRRLRDSLFAAMGTFPEKPCPLEPKVIGTLKREGYRIEKLVFQSRPDVWVTANAYVPEPAEGKLPAVLVVHGHWPWARIDPVVQARCLGLVKLGFFVLAVDAFGAGERFTAPAKGTYHGALYGSTLWPAGQTLLGMQVYDNRRAVDYLCTRPEVDADRLGVTGASGGGNQTMYAGALDERFRAVVPVCSVGNYQAYLHAACCVCEVLPGALRFCEEGDVLSLVAPRALMVVSATKDGFQFSVDEAKKSIARAEKVFTLHDAAPKLRHAIFESPHAYNQPMREAMYGWMTKWLKEKGEGHPIPEPAHEVEKPEDIRCYPDDVRPKGFLFPPSFAAVEGRGLVAKFSKPPAHAEEWEARSMLARTQLRKDILGDFPAIPKEMVKASEPNVSRETTTSTLVLHPEPDMPLPVILYNVLEVPKAQPACVLLHMGGKVEALKHPLATSLLDAGYLVAAPDLRGTGETQPKGAGIKDAPDHNIAEHALWVGRPLLGQWVFDTLCLLDWLAQREKVDRRRLAVAGIGQAGLIGLCTSALFPERVSSTLATDLLSTYITVEAYPPGTFMGLLPPGILKIADVPHLAALSAPRRLVVGGGVSPQGKNLTEAQMKEAFAFPRSIYTLLKETEKLKILGEAKPEDLAKML